MRIFQCSHCGQPVYFDNERCEGCHSLLRFDPAKLNFTAIRPAGSSGDLTTSNNPATEVQFCANHAHRACNWLADVGDSRGFCVSCRLNQTIPPLGSEKNLEAWRLLEAAKRRLVYSLIRLGLPLENKADAPDRGLAFDFLSEEAQSAFDGPVLTGHANGLITININEADPVHREDARRSMGEPYRTIIGHFRHEVGHYYWERLVRIDDEVLSGFRALFGDERKDYGESLKAHYENSAPGGWAGHYLSAYASAHPWEDWAETWAHYLHLLDTVETAHAFGIRLEPTQPNMQAVSLDTTFDPYAETSINTILSAALPLTLAVNSLNRGMGQPDIYPFVLPSPVVEKLGFIHNLIHANRNGTV